MHAAHTRCTHVARNHVRSSFILVPSFAHTPGACVCCFGPHARLSSLHTRARLGGARAAHPPHACTHKLCSSHLRLATRLARASLATYAALACSPRLASSPPTCSPRLLSTRLARRLARAGLAPRSPFAALACSPDLQFLLPLPPNSGLMLVDHHVSALASCGQGRRSHDHERM